MCNSVQNSENATTDIIFPHVCKVQIKPNILPTYLYEMTPIYSWRRGFVCPIVLLFYHRRNVWNEGLWVNSAGADTQH